MSKIVPIIIENGVITASDVMPDGECTLTACLKPLLRSMGVFGLYFNRRLQSSSGGSPSEKSWCKWNGWVIHAVFAVVLLWLNVARVFSIFTSDDRFGQILLNKMINVVWMFQCTVSQTSFYAASHLGKLQDAFMKIKLSDDCVKYIRRIAVVYTVVAWSIITLASAFFAYGVFFTNGSMDYMLAPIQTHVTTSNLLIPRIVLYFVCFYLVSAHVFPQAMTFLLAMMFTHQFKAVEKQLERCLKSQDGLVQDSEIESIRQQHQEIAMTVSNIDDCLMFSNASAFCCQLSNLIILLYLLIFYHSFYQDPMIIGAYAFWMFLLSLGLTFTATGGITLNHYVSA